ncbi:MAG: hypothetical protein V1933_00575 [Candidatus Omnitrophota bacterium]
MTEKADLYKICRRKKLNKKGGFMQSAYVRFKFEKGYIVDEAKFRKINDIIIKRLVEKELTTKLFCKIFRKDSFCFTTKNIDDLLKEDNWQNTRIIRVVLECKDESLDFELDFDEKGVSIRIEGKERDFVFLLYSDLKEFIQNEVATVRKINSLKTTSDMALILVAATFLMISILMKVPKIPAKILESSDIHEKLNFLIQRPGSPEPKSLLYMAPIVFLLLLSPSLLRRLFNYCYPYNVFVIGKEIDTYEKRINIRSKLFWGVIVTPFISLIVGAFFYLLGAKRF